MLTLSIRSMCADDLAGVLRIQAEAYADEPFPLESHAFYANRLTLSPHTCHVAVAADGALAGYIVTHPWVRDAPPRLGLPVDTLPPAADCWYLHDCAVARAARGQGAARALYVAALLSAQAHGFRQGALVALAGAVSYWQALGYDVQQRPGLDAKLAEYGAGACYMTRVLHHD